MKSPVTGNFTHHLSRELRQREKIEELLRTDSIGHSIPALPSFNLERHRRLGDAARGSQEVEAILDIKGIIKRVKRIIQSGVNTLGYEISRRRPRPPSQENPMDFLSPQDNAVPICFASFGEANPDRVFYVIYLGGKGSGFFSNVFHVLGHLTLAERLRMTPVVDMRRFPTLYNESEPISNTCNAWEYYFDQPAGFSLDDVYRSRHVAFCDGNHKRGPSLARYRWDVYDNPLATIDTARRFLRVRAPIQEEVEAFYKEFFLGKTVLGVHFRGQEHKTAPDRWACPTVEQMVSRTRMLLATYPINAIFLLTEEQAYLDAYKAAFHGMVLNTAAFRTYDVNAYNIRPYPRPLHMYRLGLDVLKDTMLLARTDYLLAGGATAWLSVRT
jgi:hypothetical protein